MPRPARAIYSARPSRGPLTPALHFTRASYTMRLPWIRSQAGVHSVHSPMERRAMPKSRPAGSSLHPGRASLAGTSEVDCRRQVVVSSATRWWLCTERGEVADMPDRAALDPQLARYTEANMDQGVQLKRTDRIRAVERVRDFIVRAVDGARAVEAPIYHLELEQVFPDDVYASMLAAMPEASDYRPLYGQNQCNVLADGTHTRVKIDLFPEYIRHLPPEKRMIWDVVGRALCSEGVKAAFVRKLAPALARRFGPSYAKVGMYPIAILTRDVPGYKIDPHTDTRWKGITVQLFLPRDASHTHIGTIFHEKLPDGSLPKRTQMKFAPNTGYAFAVGNDTWHSADPVGREVTTRDSILHTYFVDAGILRVLRMRGKRIGNFLRNELRHYAPR